MRVHDEAPADLRLDPLELGVDGRERGHQLGERIEVGRADRGVDPGNDGEHELDHRGEEQLAGALGLGGVVEELVELPRVKGPFEQGPVHDRNGTGLKEPLEQRTERHGGPPPP